MSFPFIVFWDQCCWVAGTTQHDIMAQGPDFPTAVERLRKTILSELSLCRYKGRKLGGGLSASAPFRGELFAFAYCNDGSEPDRRFRYKGTITIEIPS